MNVPRSSWSESALAALPRPAFEAAEAGGRWSSCSAAQDCALTALEIDRQAARRRQGDRLPGPGAARGTGLIQRVDLGGDAAGYERVDPGGHHHHHIVCENCGRVVAFEDERLEQAIVALGERPDFKVSSHEVTLRGECARCSAATD